MNYINQSDENLKPEELNLIRLPAILKRYNNTKQSQIKMTPAEVSEKKNEGLVYFSLYGDTEQLSSNRS